MLALWRDIGHAAPELVMLNQPSCDKRKTVRRGSVAAGMAVGEVRRAGFAGTLLLMGLLAFPTARPGSWVFALKYQDEFRQSEVAIQAVEAFRRAHGRLPDSLQEAGLPLERFDERCPCYDKKGEQSYMVWFGWVLGESVVYDSETRQWRY